MHTCSQVHSCDWDQEGVLSAAWGRDVVVVGSTQEALGCAERIAASKAASSVTVVYRRVG